jgi:hypothetical protein
MGGKVWDLWDKEKPTVAKNLGEVSQASFIAPSDPLVSGLHVPRSSTECQTTNPSIHTRLDKIPHLGSTKRTRTHVMIRVHKPVPDTRSPSISDLNGDQLDVSQLLQHTVNLVDSSKNTPFFVPSLDQKWIGSHRFRKRNEALPVELQ